MCLNTLGFAQVTLAPNFVQVQARVGRLWDAKSRPSFSGFREGFQGLVCCHVMPFLRLWTVNAYSEAANQIICRQALRRFLNLMGPHNCKAARIILVQWIQLSCQNCPVHAPSLLHCSAVWH